MNLLRNILIFSVLLLLPASLVLAQFVPLVGIPGVTDRTGGAGIGGYLNAIYRLAISLAALLAVLILIRAGLKYMFSDTISTKADAKKDIRGALLGLLLIISAVLILSTINTNLTNFNIEIAQFEVQRFDPITSPQRPTSIAELCVDSSQCTSVSCGFITTQGSCEAQCPDGLVSVGRCTVNRETCDVNGGPPCCTANEGSWNGILGRCVTPEQNVETIRCVAGEVDTVTGEIPYDCGAARTTCTSTGGTVLSQTGVSIFCERPDTNLTPSTAPTTPVTSTPTTAPTTAPSPSLPANQPVPDNDVISPPDFIGA